MLVNPLSFSQRREESVEAMARIGPIGRTEDCRRRGTLGPAFCPQRRRRAGAAPSRCAGNPRASHQRREGSNRTPGEPRKSAAINRGRAGCREFAAIERRRAEPCESAVIERRRAGPSRIRCHQQAADGTTANPLLSPRQRAESRILARMVAPSIGPWQRKSRETFGHKTRGRQRPISKGAKGSEGGIKPIAKAKSKSQIGSEPTATAKSKSFPHIHASPRVE